MSFSVQRIESRFNRSAVLAHLRQILPALEARASASSALSFGIPAIDRHLPGGGLSRDALHEFTAPAAIDMPAAFGFIAVLLGHTLLGRRGRPSLPCTGATASISASLTLMASADSESPRAVCFSLRPRPTYKSCGRSRKRCVCARYRPSPDGSAASSISRRAGACRSRRKGRTRSFSCCARRKPTSRRGDDPLAGRRGPGGPRPLRLFYAMAMAHRPRTLPQRTPRRVDRGVE
jgi:hypothetical protein